MSGAAINLGLGFSISITLGFIVFLSFFILIASYICCRTSRNRRNQNPNPRRNQNFNGVVLPGVIFGAENGDDEIEEENGGGGGGLDQTVINSYPKFQFSDENLNSNSTCSICLCEFKDLEMLRMMPECNHYFHVYCLDSWLKINGSCPVCRNSPLPTPLSEVVPLSQHATDRNIGNF